MVGMVALLSIFDWHDAQLDKFGAKEVHVAVLREQNPRNRAVRKCGLEIESELQAWRKVETAAVSQHKMPDAHGRESDAQFPVISIFVTFQIGVFDWVLQILSISVVHIPMDVLDYAVVDRKNLMAANAVIFEGRVTLGQNLI